MVQKLDYLKETPSQTAGPYVHIGLAPGAAGFDIYRQELGWDIAGPNAKGERIRVEGIVIDGTGNPVKDVLIETWQANADGVYAHPESEGEVEEGFRGWGRVITDFETGEWGFDTVKPGPVKARKSLGTGPLHPPAHAGDDWLGRGDEGHEDMAPHINLWIVARGINMGLNTRLYFDDEAEANAKDPVLNLIEWHNRRPTLIAKRSERDGKVVYRFDIRLQGEGETVFFDI
ncbi:protocatechuate 3,4-dioxygenase subunit alpha [Salipiger bermudensis]|uniref:protocatechuate 3,4-dioxygenase subunit alpha n=1 Tax=Salipiger bermudensis TaxID=344736 RepID=UPI001CD7FC55|nr:protocatechuate 3,4-dioxygenase subunit alpha [Salipiger bermudensis]MCA1288429.1 protocatechuate 3,4-dioxygenase subunit alpha [Salipiger bermudensis]